MAPEGSAAGVTIASGPLAVTWRLKVPWEVFPTLSVTLMTRESVSADAGCAGHHSGAETIQILLLPESETSDQVYGGVPPLAAIV